MTTPPTSPAEDAAAARSLLSHANPVPDPSLAPAEVRAARASVGMARATAATSRPPRGRFVAAGAVAAVSIATLVAIVAVPAGRGPGTTSLATGPGARAVQAAAAATEASRTARGLLTIAHADGTVTATGTGDFDTGEAAAEVAMADGPQEGTITVLRTASGIYARLPGGMNPMSTGKPWVSVDAPTLARLTQLALGDAAAQITGAPLDALAYLRGVSGDVAFVGPDTTRGEPTTRYRAAVDPARASAQLPAALRGHAPTSGAAPASLPADVWIDGQGRLRKLVITADESASAATGKGPSAPAAAPPGPMTITLELWDFGIPVEVSAPPADQVSDVSGLLGTFAQNLHRP